MESIEKYVDRVKDLSAKKDQLAAAVEKARLRKVEQVIQERIDADELAKAKQTQSQANFLKTGSRFKSAEKVRKKNYQKKAIIDQLPSHLKGRTVRHFSPKHCENYSQYLYQRGLMIDQVHRERSKEALAIREKEEVKGLSFVPKINEKSREIAKSRPPLLDRTAENLEKSREEMIRMRSRSYRKHQQCVQSTTKKQKPKKKFKEVLDPEDYDNFFKKNMEWLKHRENKIEFLQSEKKRKEEIEELRSMVPAKHIDDAEYQFDDPLYEDMYRRALFVEQDRGLARVSKKLHFAEDEEIFIHEDNKSLANDL